VLLAVLVAVAVELRVTGLLEEMVEKQHLHKETSAAVVDKLQVK
jgi:hypothetical protein